MKLTLRPGEDKVLYLSCEGSITQAQMKPGVDLLEQACGPGVYGRRVLLNMEKTGYIDSSGIGWMMICHKRFTREGGRLVYYSIPPLVKQMFDLLKLNLVFSLATDEASARQLALEGGK